MSCDAQNSRLSGRSDRSPGALELRRDALRAQGGSILTARRLETTTAARPLPASAGQTERPATESGAPQGKLGAAPAALPAVRPPSRPHGP